MWIDSKLMPMINMYHAMFPIRGPFIDREHGSVVFGFDKKYIVVSLDESGNRRPVFRARVEGHYRLKDFSSTDKDNWEGRFFIDKSQYQGQGVYILGLAMLQTIKPQETLRKIVHIGVTSNSLLYRESDSLPLREDAFKKLKHWITLKEYERKRVLISRQELEEFLDREAGILPHDNEAGLF